MVRPDLVARKVQRASARLAEAEAILSRSKEEFLKEVQERDLASFYLFLAIQESIDLAVHWIADAGWQVPEDAGSAFDLLAERERLDLDLAQRLRGAVGLRNRIAHDYATVDHGRMYDEYREGIAAVRRFLDRVRAEAGL